VQPLLAALGRAAMYVGEGELSRIWKIAHNTMFGVIIQSLCEITLLAEKAGIPRHVFLDSINDSVLGSMYTRYKTPALVNLDFTTTFTPKLLLKDMELGMGAAKARASSMPTASVTRDSMQSLSHQYPGDIDFSVLLLEQARAGGMTLEPENVQAEATDSPDHARSACCAPASSSRRTRRMACCRPVTCWSRTTASPPSAPRSRRRSRGRRCSGHFRAAGAGQCPHAYRGRPRCARLPPTGRCSSISATSHARAGDGVRAPTTSISRPCRRAEPARSRRHHLVDWAQQSDAQPHRLPASPA
jgi:hypothetical protein